jgi:hypothetical protein
MRFLTVPWVPGLERQQLTRVPYVALRSTAVIWQLGRARARDDRGRMRRLGGGVWEMRIELHSTGQIVELDGVLCRVWEGTTAAGVKLTAFIARVAVERADDSREFERELLETSQPRPTEAWPTRMTFRDLALDDPDGVN